MDGTVVYNDYLRYGGLRAISKESLLEKRAFYEFMVEAIDSELTDRAFICEDCGVDTGFDGVNEYYMVHKHLWEKATEDAEYMLCIGCLETRLGRTLKKKDFTDAEINWCDDPKSDRLMDRLGRLNNVSRT